MGILSLIVATAFAANAATADWHIVTMSDNDGEVTLQWIDTASITTSGTDNRKAWAYFISRKEAVHTLAQFDCKERRMLIDQITVEKPDGSTEQVPGASGWSSVPDTQPLARVLDYVCSGGTAKTDLVMATGDKSPVQPSWRVLDQFYAEKEKN